MVDKSYCMSSFLMYRLVADKSKRFFDELPVRHYAPPADRVGVSCSNELERYIQSRVGEATIKGNTALALSAGIDSAILAKYMPKNSIAYTFRCIVPGKRVADESDTAAEYAKECGLTHRIIDIYWEDFEQYAPVLMRHKGAPVHSIEIMIYKAALTAKKEGIDTLIFGEGADALYGGLDGLLSRGWLVGEFIDRFSNVKPYHALKSPRLPIEPIMKLERDGYIDPHDFISSFFFEESYNSYRNACETGGIRLIAPYAETWLASKVDYARIRSGESKYVIRELFTKLYHGRAIPQKVPMPRATNEWLQDWKGPVRSEFLPHCTDRLTGDQKWLIYCLESFLNLYERGGDE